MAELLRLATVFPDEKPGEGRVTVPPDILVYVVYVTDVNLISVRQGQQHRLTGWVPGVEHAMELDDNMSVDNQSSMEGQGSCSMDQVGGEQIHAASRRDENATMCTVSVSLV